jgi:DNA modification methylase
VRDRLTRSWESIFFFTKTEKYHFDLNAIRKPFTATTLQRVQTGYNDKVKITDENFNTRKGSDWNNKIKQNLAVIKTGNHHGSSITTRATYYEGYSPQTSPLGANPGDVWTLTNEGLKDEHFAAFPQKLVRRILSCSMPKGGLLLDPFAGAGTSLLVAHKMGFDWLGIELVPKYCKIIEKRIDRHGRVRLDGFLSTVGGKETSLNPLKME